MRLLNTKTYEVVEFYTDIPKYAILSHTWEKEEVTFQDIQNLDIAKTRDGWSKIKNACRHARKYKFHWIWIDLCCIDKSSSAELSEVLNSMYQYYTDAEVCYVYLCDASSKENPRDAKSRFWSSKWFTRGWTLQELIAPMYAVFLDTNWKEIGTRWGLRDVLSTITTIPVQIFEGRDIDEYSIAQKMSWAAYRQTTRPEDQAYCLMGIFNVNMPPIYGEGGVAAFMRLQQEIIKVSDDRSIFAWTSKSEDDSKVRGLLARSPEEFRASGGVRMADLEESSIGAKSSFSFANNGLRIHLPIAPNRNGSSSSEGTIFLASLHCCCPCERHSTGSCLFIYLQKIGEQQYVRYRPNEVVVTSSSAESKDWKEVVIKENSLPRKAKRSSGSETKIVDIRLSSSNQQQLRQFTAHKPPIVDSIIVRMGYLTSTLLYDPSSAFHKDSFSLVLGISASRDGVNGTVETVAAIQGNIRNNPTLLDGIPNQCLPADSVQLPMKKGLMHAHLQMTGTVRRILEIYYELMDDQSQIMLQPEPPILGCVFTVPLSVGGLPYEFVGILPRYSFDRGLRSSRYDYIPVYTNNPRLLIYREQNSEPRFFVVLGLHESGEVWTDVWWSSEYNHQTLDYEKMWLSYLDSGHRKPKAASASATIDHHSSRWDIATTVQKIQDTTLQIGSHLLRFDTKTNDT